MDFARDQKRELGCQWKEGASIAQKTSGEWIACPEQILPPLTPGNSGKAKARGGSLRTLLPQDEAVAPSNPQGRKKFRSGVPGLQDRLGQPHCLWGIGTKGFTVARHSCERGRESPSQHPPCPYPTPRGRPPAPSSSAPASQPAPENPVVRPPHPCENTDAGFPIPFNSRFLQGPWHASPSLSSRT